MQSNKGNISCGIHVGNLVGINFIGGFVIAVLLMLLGEPVGLTLVAHTYIYPVPLQSILISVGLSILYEIIYNIKIMKYEFNYGNICVTFIGTIIGIIFIASSVIFAYYLINILHFC